MAGTAYHMEALRKTRVIERKNEAMKKLKESIGQKGDASGGQFDTGDTPLVFSEPGHYAQNREFSLYTPPQTQTKKFVRREREDIIRKKTPDSVKKIQRDQVLTYYKIGRHRDQRQYDHSRNGPVVDKTNYALKREFNFLGSSLSMLKRDIVPSHKPIPTSRRF